MNQSINQSDGTTFSRFISAFLLVWTSPGGYNHSHTGQKVAQIQAVLARRCAVIGELQQHLLRAGWQRGVAQWGVLGKCDHYLRLSGCYSEMIRRTLTQLFT